MTKKSLTLDIYTGDIKQKLLKSNKTITIFLLSIISFSIRIIYIVGRAILSAKKMELLYFAK